MNIREYNFAIPGNVDRHIPGIPGIFPAGSIVLVDEDTNQVVQVTLGSSDELQLVIPGPVELREFTGFDVRGNAVQDSLIVPTAPPAVDKKSKAK